MCQPKSKKIIKKIKDDIHTLQAGQPPNMITVGWWEPNAYG